MEKGKIIERNREGGEGNGEGKKVRIQKYYYFGDLERGCFVFLYWCDFFLLCKYFQLDVDKYENDLELEKIRKERNYFWMDIIIICKDKLLNYEEKVREF